MKVLTTAASLALCLAAANTHAAECRQGYKEMVVSGTVNTINISDTMQVGSIDMQLTSVKSGRVVFDQTGAVVGTITGQTIDDYGRPVTILNHTIIFDDGATIETDSDTATITGAISECSFNVDEVISDFWGTKTFKRATGTINATGSISIPPDCNNQNQFDLSGTLCLKRAK